MFVPEKNVARNKSYICLKDEEYIRLFFICCRKELELCKIRTLEIVGMAPEVLCYVCTLGTVRLCKKTLFLLFYYCYEHK